MTANAEVPEPAETLSWRVGPADSRLVRTLMYLGEGWFGGALLYGGFRFGRSVLPASASGSRVLLGLGAFLLAVALRWLWFLLWHRGVIRRGGEPRLWSTQEWLATYRWPRVVALVAVVGGALVATDLWLPLRGDAREWLWYGSLFVAVTAVFAASVLSTRGEIDPEALALRTVRYGEWRDLDLRTVTAIRRVRLGGSVVLWLSVTPGVEKRTASQGVYVMPASAFERAAPVFEAGLDAPVPLDDEAVDRGRFFRRVNRAVAVGILAAGVAFFAFSVWIGLPPAQLFVFVWALAAFGAFLVKLAV